MRIIAIDPGCDKSAYVTWDDSSIYANPCLKKGVSPNINLRNMLKDIDVDVLVIETIQSFGMPVGKEVFETMFWIGRFCEAWNKKYILVSRREIKLHFCNSVRAKDSNVRRVVLDRLGKEGTKGIVKDLWSALALALWYSDNHLKAET